MGASTYDVFDSEGRFPGAIATPDDFEPLRSDGGYVYGVGRDDSGVEYAVRLHVVK